MSDRVTDYHTYIGELEARIEALESLGRINISARDTLLTRIEALEAALRKIATEYLEMESYRSIARDALAPEQEK